MEQPCRRRFGSVLLLTALLAAGCSREQAPAEIYRRYGKAIALVNTQFTPTVQGEGTGFLVTANGLLVTVAHGAAGAQRIEVRLPEGGTYRARLLAEDDRRDLAVLQLLGAPANLPTVALGDSDRVTVGERVTVIGNPGLPVADVEPLVNTISEGLVSGLRASSIVPAWGPGYKLLQISAPVFGGNSGSPVFDARGRVIGIVSKGLPLTRVYDSVGDWVGLADSSTVGFAVPVNYVRRLLPRKQAKHPPGKKIPQKR